MLIDLLTITYFTVNIVICNYVYVYVLIVHAGYIIFFFLKYFSRIAKKNHSPSILNSQFLFQLYMLQ